MEKILLCFLFIQILFQWPSQVHGTDIELEKFVRKILSGRKLDVNPCDDFYTHVCGNWNAKKNLLFENVDELMKLSKDILERDVNSNTGKVVKEQFWYNTCKYRNTGNEIHIMKNYVDAAGGLLLPNNYNIPAGLRTWQDVAKFYAENFGRNAFFDIHLNRKNILKIKILPNIEYGNIKEQLFQRDVKEMFQRFFPYFSLYIEEPSVNEAYQHLNHLIRQMGMIKEERTIKYKNVTIGKLRNLRNKCGKEQIDWLEIFEATINNANITFSDDEEINVDLNLLCDLSALLNEMENHAIVNYIHYYYTMSNEFKAIWNPIINEWSEDKVASSCIARMPIYDGYTSIIKNNEISKESKKFVHDMFENIRNETQEEIKNSWWKNKSKYNLLRKLSKMKFLTDKLFIFPNEYTGQIISDDFDIGLNCVLNLMNFNKAQIKYAVNRYKNRKSYRKRNRRYKREMTVFNHYNFEENAVEFMLTYLLKPNFNLKAPLAVKYGSLGFIISSKINLIFTKLFWHSENGNERRLSSSKNSFDDSELVEDRKNEFTPVIRENITNCYLNYFATNETPESMSIDNLITFSTGIKISFKSFQQEIQDQLVKEEKLPGLQNLTEEELFFIAFGAFHCVKPADENYGENYWHHANSINQILKTSEDFARTFKCPQDSPMNPPKKCDIFVKRNPQEIITEMDIELLDNDGMDSFESMNEDFEMDVSES